MNPNKMLIDIFLSQATRVVGVAGYVLLFGTAFLDSRFISIGEVSRYMPYNIYHHGCMTFIIRGADVQTLSPTFRNCFPAVTVTVPITNMLREINHLQVSVVEVLDIICCSSWNSTSN